MKISEVFPTLEIDGAFFNEFNSTYGLTPFQLGLGYFNHSGDKTVSKLVRKYTDNGVITPTGQSVIGLMLNDYFSKNWDRIWAAYQANYDPLSNYDMREESTDVKGEQENINNYGDKITTNLIGETATTNVFGATTETNLYGEKNSTESIGATTDINTYGAKSNTDTIGGLNTTNTYGAFTESETLGSHTDSASTSVNGSTVHGQQDKTTENDIAAFNSSTYQDSDRTTESINSYTDTETSLSSTETTIGSQDNSKSISSHTDQISESSRTNSHSETEHVDTLTSEAHTNTTKENSHTDTLSNAEHTDTVSTDSHTDTITEGYKIDNLTEGSRTDTHTLTRTGNIGVTTSQQMLESELSLRKYDFYKNIYEDIDSLLTLKVYC